MNARKIAFFGLLGAMALALSYVDRMLPLDFIAPGVRLGLGNMVLLYAIYVLRPADAAVLMLLKVALNALLFGFGSFPYSLAGGILSLIAMLLACRAKLSILTVSILGGVMHNIGQISVAALLTSTALIITYLPVLLFFGVIMGLATGLVAKYVLRALAYTDKAIRDCVAGTDIMPK